MKDIKVGTYFIFLYHRSSNFLCYRNIFTSSADSRLKNILKMTSMLAALITCPALLAVNEAIRQGQSRDRREEHRARRSNLVVSCVAPTLLSREIDRQHVVLLNSKVFFSRMKVISWVDSHAQLIYTR